MAEIRPRRISKWWLLPGILLGLPLLAMFVLRVIFSFNEIRPDQLQPPKGNITLQTRSAPVTSAKPANKQTFDDLLAENPNRELAALYARLASENPVSKWEPLFAKWSLEPLTPAQTQWLIDNRELVDDVLKLSKASNAPVFPCEEAMSRISPINNSIPVPDFLSYQTYARMLSAESMRRLEAGDEEGAAEALLAAFPLANSIQEPTVISHLVALRMQTTANRCLAQWLGNGEISPKVAARLRDKLANEMIATSNYRRVLEVEYANARTHIIAYLNGPVTRMIQETIRVRSIKDELLVNPAGMSGKLAFATYRSVKLKANASNFIKNYDSYYQSTFEAIERNEIATVDAGNLKDLFVPNFTEVQVRTNANLALLRCDIAGLDTIAGGPGNQTDPFSNAPLCKIDETTSTLIYSLGPDKKDQHAQLKYDPTNGTLSEGDIWVRVKKR